MIANQDMQNQKRTKLVVLKISKYKNNDLN